MTHDAPLYERDPAAWETYLAEGNAKQPRKRVSADVIVVNQAGDVLLVDPAYKPDWDLPGGMVEANEPPDDAAHREFMEELGFDLQIGRLLCIDWVAPHGPWDDLLAFVFDGGELSDKQVASLKVSDQELASFEFCDTELLERRLRPYAWRRAAAALDALRTGGSRYLQNGSPR
jgi:8-oxo-dGTP pyrophosphatase MutT (NUDIX family)